MKPQTERLPAVYFARRDEQADALFYSFPRKVVHLDEPALTAYEHLLDDILCGSDSYLDLMSSWRTHLSDYARPKRLIGLGLNAAEMADNPQLTEYVVHDLNQTPRLPFETAQFDSVICTVSVQYLTQPLEVFAEINRVLKPGGRFIVAFSNRYFAQKAIAIWLSMTDDQHIDLVSYYFQNSGNWVNLRAIEKTASPIDKVDSDPLYVLWAEKGDMANEPA